MRCHSQDIAIEIKKWGYGEGKLLKSTYKRSYIVLQRACRLQCNKILNFSTSMAGHTQSWSMSLEPQWLVIISLQQRQHKNYYNSTVTKLLGNGAVDQLLKITREGQYSIVFESIHFRSLEQWDIEREKRQFLVGRLGLGTWSIYPSLCPTELESQKTTFAYGMLYIPVGYSPANESSGFTLIFKPCNVLAPHTHNFAFPIYVF